VFDDLIDPTNIDCEVVQIDNQPALNFITDYANIRIGSARDLGVRFNLALTSLTLVSGIAAPSPRSQQFTKRVILPDNKNYTYTLACPNVTKTITRDWTVELNFGAFNNSEITNPITYFETFCLNSPSKNTSTFSEKLEFKTTTSNLYEINPLYDQQVTQGELIFDATVMKFYLLPNNIGVAVIAAFVPSDPTSSIITLANALIDGFHLLGTRNATKVIFIFREIL